MEKSDIKYFPLATLGAIKGVYEVFVHEPLQDPNRASNVGWAGLIAGISAYEILAPETLSQGVDRALEKHPVATVLAVGVVALHLINVIPPKYDPLYRLTKLK